MLRSRSRASLVFVGALAAVVAAPLTAHAALSEHVVWTAEGWYYCDPDVNGRRCTYYLDSTSCPEVAVLGEPVAECVVTVRATVWVVPVFSAGRVVGCTTVGPHRQNNGYVSFDSTFPQFDNPEIDRPFMLDVYDVFADHKPGAAELVALDEDQGPGLTTRWTVWGEFTASCAPTTGMPTSTAIGTVTVVES